MSDQTPRPFDFTSVESLAASLHAQLLARRRATLEHDIKNVVHGIMSGTELLSKSLTATSARISPAECVTLLQQQLARAQATLHRMLDEVAPDADAVADIELAELIAECTHALRHQLQPFTVDVDVQQGIKLRGIRSRLKDSVQFAVLDCVDRAPQRSRIAIVARSGQSRGTLTVQHAEDAAQKPSPLLSIAPLLAPDDIRIETEGNAGERLLRFSFPLLAASASTPLDLLIVDANRDGADSLVMLVQLEGFKAEACYDAAAALEAIRAHTPRAVLVDLDGALDGRALVRTIRNAHAQSLRVIGLSHVQLEPIAGLDTALRMPLDLSALRRAMG